MMFNTLIFDWKQTLYDPASSSLIAGAIEVLEYLASLDLDMYLIGKGGDDMDAEIKRLGVKKYFKKRLFVATSKHPDHFKSLVGATDYSKVLVIGDKLNSEIEVGNKLGAKTIQVKQGKFMNEKPETEDQIPNKVVHDLPELKSELIQIFH